MHGRAPNDLDLPLAHIADVPGHRALCSACTNLITLPPITSTYTVDSRAFLVAAPLIWNSLSDDVISA